MATVCASGNCLRMNGPNATVALVPLPSSSKTFLPVSSAGSADTPTIVGIAPPSTPYIDALPIATMPSTFASTPLVLTICWPQVVPCASDVAMKQVASCTGCPCTPPSSVLIILTTACAARVASGKVWLGGPPCWLTQPIVTGDRLALALPEPPTYCWKLVTAPLAALPAGDDEAGAGGLAACDAGAAVLAAPDGWLVPGLELHAVIPAARQAAKASAPHRDPVPVLRRI